MTNKILALTDALGNLVRFELLPGNRYDTISVAPLIDGVAFDALLGEKAFDANWIVEELDCGRNGSTRREGRHLPTA